MFVVSRNGNKLYPNQLIMLNAIMSDTLALQRNFITGTGAKCSQGKSLNEQILATQSKVAGLLDDEPVSLPVPSVSERDLARYKPIIKGTKVTPEMVAKNKKVYAEFKMAFDLIKKNLETQIAGLNEAEDLELKRLLEALSTKFGEIKKIIDMAESNNILLTDDQLLLINLSLGELFKSLSSIIPKV